jgi:hypothetical protein
MAAKTPTAFAAISRYSESLADLVGEGNGSEGGLSVVSTNIDPVYHGGRPEGQRDSENAFQIWKDLSEGIKEATGTLLRSGKTQHQKQFELPFFPALSPSPFEWARPLLSLTSFFGVPLEHVFLLESAFFVAFAGTLRCEIWDASLTNPPSLVPFGPRRSRRAKPRAELS